MKVRIFADAARASRAVARLIARQLESQPASVLGLPTGRTSVAVYKELVRLGPDFSRARTFNLDEFVGVPARHRRSYHAFMDRHLFCRVNIPAPRAHFLDGAARDLDAECARFERAIAAAGGIDLLLLGIGVNGHIGFNEPGTALFARTHRARLTAATRRANAELFGGQMSKVPREALSMGIGTILAGGRADCHGSLEGARDQRHVLRPHHAVASGIVPSVASGRYAGSRPGGVERVVGCLGAYDTARAEFS